MTDLCQHILNYELPMYHSSPVLLICLVFFYPLLGIVEFLVLFYDLECRMLEFNHLSPVGLFCECGRMSLL